MSFALFPMSNRMNGEAGLPLPLLRMSGETAMMQEKTLISVEGYPELCCLRFLLIWQFTSQQKPKIWVCSHYNALISLTGQLIWWLPSNIKNSFLNVTKSKDRAVHLAFADIKNAFDVIVALYIYLYAFSSFYPKWITMHSIIFFISSWTLWERNPWPWHC